MHTYIPGIVAKEDGVIVFHDAQVRGVAKLRFGEYGLGTCTRQSGQGLWKRSETSFAQIGQLEEAVAHWDTFCTAAQMEQSTACVQSRQRSRSAPTPRRRPSWMGHMHATHSSHHTSRPSCAEMRPPWRWERTTHLVRDLPARKFHLCTLFKWVGLYGVGKLPG